MSRLFLIAALAALIGCSGRAEEASDRTPAGTEAFQVLVFTKTAGFRHESIPDGIAAMERMGGEHGFSVFATEDSTVFTPENLAQYEAVVFLNTTGDILGDAEEAALQEFVEGGGGFVGIHSATDTEYEWPWYGRLVGAYFASHPRIQEATVHVENLSHPSMAHLPAEWVRTDEWYDFRANPRPNVNVLARLDESTYEGGRMGDDHPIVWFQEHGSVRSWYTALGHTSESYQEPLFLQHVLGGLLWVTRRVEISDGQ